MKILAEFGHIIMLHFITKCKLSCPITSSGTNKIMIIIYEKLHNFAMISNAHEFLMDVLEDNRCKSSWNPQNCFFVSFSLLQHHLK